MGSRSKRPSSKATSPGRQPDRPKKRSRGHFGDAVSDLLRETGVLSLWPGPQSRRVRRNARALAAESRAAAFASPRPARERPRLEKRRAAREAARETRKAARP